MESRTGAWEQAELEARNRVGMLSTMNEADVFDEDHDGFAKRHSELMMRATPSADPAAPAQRADAASPGTR
jgi:hypothetical protein